MGHSLMAAQIARLPSLLNEFFAPHRHHIQVRIEHGYTGSIVEAENGGWDWESSDFDDWELEQGKLEEEDLWDWGWYPEQGQSFEKWFQAEKSSGSICLRGCYGMAVYIGSRSLVLSTGIRWHHFVFDPITQGDLRRFLGCLVQFFGVSIVIYMPDDISPGCDVLSNCINQGLSLEESRAWLTSQEPPAQSLREMITTVYVGSTKCWSARGYYVEEIEASTFVAQLNNPAGAD